MPSENKINCQYEVLSPWAEADPIPLNGISPRVSSLTGKRVGLFCNTKPAAKRIAPIVAEKLKARIPDVETTIWESGEMFSIMQLEGKDKEKFEDWLKGVDTVIATVGD